MTEHPQADKVMNQGPRLQAEGGGALVRREGPQSPHHPPSCTSLTFPGELGQEMSTSCPHSAFCAVTYPFMKHLLYV